MSMSMLDTSTDPSEAVEAASGLWRTNLQHYDLSILGREMVQARVDIGPSSPPIRHFHPGEALTVPAGVIHAVRNVGTGNAAELATYVVEKSKPLLTVAQ